jgi:hypothetical protein
LFSKEVQGSGDQSSTPSLNVVGNDDDGDDKGSHTSGPKQTKVAMSLLDDQDTCSPSPNSVTHADEEEKDGGHTQELKQAQLFTSHDHLDNEGAACVPSPNTTITQRGAWEDDRIPNQSVSLLVGEQEPPSLEGQEKEAFPLSSTKQVDWTGLISNK